MESLKREAKEIGDSLEGDIFQAADKLLQFTNEYSINTQLKQRALKLNWDMEGCRDNAESADQSQELQTEIASILHEVISVADAAPEQTQNYVDGRKAIRNSFLRQEQEQEIIFSGKNLSYHYGGEEGFMLEPFDIDMRLGEITTVVGKNGSGKSTLIRVVAGEHLAASGEATYPLFSSEERFDWVTVKEKIAYIPQRISQWTGVVRDYLHFTAAIKGIRGRENRDEVNYIISRLGLERYQHRKWSELSGGFQMRFELARMLVWKPRLLILDEPLANLDVNAQETFLRDLQQLTNSMKNPISVLITSQHLYETEGISDRILFLDEGKVVYNDLTVNFGRERKTNIFEFASSASLDEVRLLLLNHGISELSTRGQYFVATTGLDINSRRMLQILTESDNTIEILYFRDISKSTRVLFK